MGEEFACPHNYAVYQKRRARRRLRNILAFIAVSLVTLFYLPSFWTLSSRNNHSQRLPIDAARILSRCADLKVLPGVPVDFYSRSQSNRFAPGTKSVLIHNATIWTGGDSGNEEFKGDIVMNGGIIKWVGGGGLDYARKNFGQDLVTVDAKGAWVTPG